MKLSMMMFIDQVDYMRKKDDLFDFLIRQTDDVHVKFLYGERPEIRDTLSLYECLIKNVNKIRYSDDEIVWTKENGLMFKCGQSDEYHELHFAEDIKKIYMEQLS